MEALGEIFSRLSRSLSGKTGALVLLCFKKEPEFRRPIPKTFFVKVNIAV